MYKRYKQNGKVCYAIEEYIVDSVDEIRSIPCRTFGSKVFVIDTRDEYMLNSKKMWKCITNEREDIPSCDCVEESTIWEELV